MRDIPFDFRHYKKQKDIKFENPLKFNVFKILSAPPNYFGAIIHRY